MHKHATHFLFYFTEVIVVLGVFLLLLTLPLSLFQEMMLLFLMFVVYGILGLLHHRIHHDIKVRVVLEYILVSGLLLILYLFLNISRI